MMALHRLKLLKFLLGGVIVGFALAAFSFRPSSLNARKP